MQLAYNSAPVSAPIFIVVQRSVLLVVQHKSADVVVAVAIAVAVDATACCSFR